MDDTTEFAVCSNATIQDKHAPEWCCWAAAREYLRSARSRTEPIWQKATRFMCGADNLSTGSLANLEQRARSNSPPERHFQPVRERHPGTQQAAGPDGLHAVMDIEAGRNRTRKEFARRLDRQRQTWAMGIVQHVDCHGLVPGGGLEPPHCYQRRILNPFSCPFVLIYHLCVSNAKLD